MPIFRYRGYNASGGSAVGTVEADGIKDAAAKVKAMGYYPKEIEAASRKRGRWRLKRPDTHALPALTRQLSVLLASGVPLVEALRALSKEARGDWRERLVDLREKVAGGLSLSRALDAHEKVFPEFYRNMVAAGEQSGTQDVVLDRLADFLESQESVRARVRTAMVYPLFMAGVGMVVLSFLFTFVVPKIVRVFENYEAALPLPTVILIGISDFFVNYWWALIILAGLLGYAGRRALEKHRPAVDGLLMRAFPSLFLARFSRSLGFLLEGGLPMLRSLELAGKTTGNAWLNGVIRRAGVRVTEGARLSASLEGFPPVMLELVATGEKSGRLSEVLDKAANTYETDFDRKVQRALALLEPVMILLMGAVVGFIVFAVLLPMFQLNQLIG